MTEKDRNNIFKRTEYTLYNYKSLEIKIKNIEIDIENLVNEYQGVTGITYEERTGPTNKFNSSVENEVIRREEELGDLIEGLHRSRTYNLNIKKKIDNALGTLPPDELRLVQLRYFKKPKPTWIAIGKDLTMDKDYCCKKRDEIINHLSELIYSY